MRPLYAPVKGAPALRQSSHGNGGVGGGRYGVDDVPVGVLELIAGAVPVAVALSAVLLEPEELLESEELLLPSVATAFD